MSAGDSGRAPSLASPVAAVSPFLLAFGNTAASTLCGRAHHAHSSAKRSGASNEISTQSVSSGGSLRRTARAASGSVFRYGLSALRRLSSKLVVRCIDPAVKR